MKKAFLTYTIIALVSGGGMYASINKTFAPLYSVFVYGLLGAKSLKHLSSFGSQFLDNQAAKDLVGNSDPALQPIIPSEPVPQNPIG